MTIYEDTNSKPLLDLLDRIHSGDMVLPDFQRDFVWEPSATQALIVSIANNYPAGSILRVRDTQRVFSSRAFEGAPTAAPFHSFLVLDGQQRLTSLYQAFYGVGDHRYFPVVTLSAETEPAALCTIFETLNRTGVKLSVFELLTARFWSQDLKLRELWQQACSDHPLIAHFDVDPYYVLMAIALASGKTPSCKRGDVLNLTAGTVTQWWQPVIEALALSLTILHDDCWVLEARWLPFNTMLSPMAAALAAAGASKGVAIGAQREQIKRWFWCSVFSQAYEKSPNTQSGRDVGELIPWLSDSAAPAPENVPSFHFNNRCLIDRETNQRISFSAPSDYMAELRDEPGFPMETVLASHLIPHGNETGLWTDDFERFLAQRQELVGAAIVQATGATHEKPALVR